MASDPTTIIRTPNNWLKRNLQYEGRGRAEFADPKGAIEGLAKVSFNSSGVCSVLIQVERIDAPDPSAFTLDAPASPQDYRMHGGFNPCVSLTVHTDDGQFTATERILHDGFSFLPASPRRIHLRPVRSRFEVKGAHKASYWVLPLSNFVLDHWRWPQAHPDLANHPLRVPPMPVFPADLCKEDLRPATARANRRNGLLTFLVNGQPGFIEQLPRYRRRIRQLQRGRVSRLITAVMVGPAHVQSVDFSDYVGLFPIDVLNLLDLATGVPVSAPWIEFRDEEGHLVLKQAKDV